VGADLQFFRTFRLPVAAAAVSLLPPSSLPRPRKSRRRLLLRCLNPPHGRWWSSASR